MSHTILLLQENNDKASRTWYEYDSVPEMVNGLCSLYERHLRATNRGGTVSYNLNELFVWVDTIPDLASMVLRREAKMYEPRDREWVKRACIEHLKKTAKR